jgi:hypothetical protein
MGLPAVSSTFRFSSRQYGLALTSRQLGPTTSSRRSSKRMFLRSALLQNKFPNSEASGHPESAAQTRLDDNGSHSSCPCCRQRKFINMDYDQGASRSPMMDATLTALMGMGIGEPQPCLGQCAWVVSVLYHAIYGRMFSLGLSCLTSHADPIPVGQFSGSTAKIPGEATQPTARWSYTSTRTCSGLSVRRCCEAGVAEPIPFFLSPNFEFCSVFGTHLRLS